MKKLKVNVYKVEGDVSACLPEVPGYLIVASSFKELKKELPIGIKFHIEGLYPEEVQPWMNEEFEFDFQFCDISSLLDAYKGIINQSVLARLSGINESLMRQYVSGIRTPSAKTMHRVEDGLKKYAEELQKISFAIS